MPGDKRSATHALNFVPFVSACANHRRILGLKSPDEPCDPTGHDMLLLFLLLLVVAVLLGRGRDHTLPPHPVVSGVTSSERDHTRNETLSANSPALRQRR